MVDPKVAIVLYYTVYSILYVFLRLYSSQILNFKLPGSVVLQAIFSLGLVPVKDGVELYVAEVFLSVFRNQK